jgi:hypothetical protein
MPTILERAGPALRVRGWPPELPPPPGATADADGALHGPLSLRSSVRRKLQAAGAPFVDALALPPLPPERLPACPLPPPPALAAWRRHGGHGIAAGLPEGERIDLVLSAVHHTAAATLLLVRDSGASMLWQRHLQQRPGSDAIDVVTLSAAMHRFSGRAPRHDLLVTAQPELLPRPELAAAIAGLSPAHVLALVDHAGPELVDVSAWAGPLVQVVRRTAAARLVELHLPLSPVERREHDAAWHEFLAAYDVFAAVRPGLGFGTFVQQARSEPAWRPALLAWHTARAVAAWNEAKATACGELLARHRGARVLVFTPDRGSAYELSRRHLIAPLTSELPKAERRALLEAFLRGALHVLAGPRLIELGVPAGCAQVGIVAGGGYGQHDHRARFDRVAASGVVYELIAQQTAEVGRARRFADALRR